MALASGRKSRLDRDTRQDGPAGIDARNDNASLKSDPRPSPDDVSNLPTAVSENVSANTDQTQGTRSQLRIVFRTWLIGRRQGVVLDEGEMLTMRSVLDRYLRRHTRPGTLLLSRLSSAPRYPPLAAFTGTAARGARLF